MSISRTPWLSSSTMACPTMKRTLRCASELKTLFCQRTDILECQRQQEDLQTTMMCWSSSLTVWEVQIWLSHPITLTKRFFLPQNLIFPTVSYISVLGESQVWDRVWGVPAEERPAERGVDQEQSGEGQGNATGGGGGLGWWLGGRQHQGAQADIPGKDRTAFLNIFGGNMIFSWAHCLA